MAGKGGRRGPQGGQRVAVGRGDGPQVNLPLWPPQAGSPSCPECPAEASASCPTSPGDFCGNDAHSPGPERLTGDGKPDTLRAQQRNPRWGVSPHPAGLSPALPCFPPAHGPVSPSPCPGLPPAPHDHHPVRSAGSLQGQQPVDLRLLFVSLNREGSGRSEPVMGALGWSADAPGLEGPENWCLVSGTHAALRPSTRPHVSP